VAFTDGGHTISGCGAAAVSTAGTATCTVTYATAGSHTIVATYSGDGALASSSSAALTETVTASSGPGGGGGPGSGHTSLSHITVSGNTVAILLHCIGASSTTCAIKLLLSISETFRGHKLIAVGARSKGRAKTTRKRVTLGVLTLTLHGGQSRTARVSLNAAGKRLLAQRRKLNVSLRVSQTRSGHVTSLLTKTLHFAAPAKKNHHRGR
jgi:hypothetical protein